MIDTHDALMSFGKHKGQRVTRVPISYLNWAVATGIQQPVETKSGVFPFCDVAKAEIERRGERLQDIDVSAHAIDRLSLRYRKRWHETRGPEEGIYSWAQRVALEAWGNREGEGRFDDQSGTWTIEHLGIDWVIEEFVIPVVKTVK